MYQPNLGNKFHWSASKETVLDLLCGIRMYDLWTKLAWNDVKQRHQRSLLGPLWLTISMGVLIGALGLLYANLFKMDLRVYLPFLTVGFVLWQLISGIVLDGCNIFISAEGIIKQIKLPFSVHIFRLLWRNLLTFFHNSLVIILIMLVFNIGVNWDTLLLFLGLLLIVLNGLWFSFLIGMLCARYRDVSPTIVSLMQLSFFITPIIWNPTLLPDRQFVLLYNPFYHFVESVRGPILGTPVTSETWFILIIITVFGWVIILPIVGRMKRHLVYWL